MSRVDVLNRPIRPTLFHLALPMVIGIIAVLSINLVDAYFLGQLGIEPLAAISFTFPIVFTLGSFAIGLGAGTSSVVSRAYGSGEMGRVRQLATHSLVLAFLLVSILSWLGLMTIEWQFERLGAQPDVMPLIKDYMQIWYFGLPMLVIPMVANSLLRAGGDTRLPSMIMVAAAIINIILDPILIHGGFGLPAMGMQGAALASVFSRFITLVISLGVVIFKEKLICFKSFKIPLLIDSWRSILSVGLPAACGNMLNPIAIGVITGLVAPYGTVAVASYGVATRVEAFLYIPLLALSAAISPFAGQNFGAGQIHRLYQAFWVCAQFCFLWSLVLGFLCLFFAESLTGLFSADPFVIQSAASYLRWVSFSSVGYGFLVIFASGFNAIGMAELGLMLYGTRNFLFMIPITMAALLLLNEKGLALGVAVSNLIAATTIALFTFWFLRQKYPQLREG
jgi:putative MATE family efflux protein